MYQTMNSVSNPSTIDLQDKETKQKFDQWMIKSSLLQIRLITALTSLLYIIYALINSIKVSSDVLPLMLTIHLYILPPLLFLISLMTFKKDFHKLTIFLLIIAPIIAAIGNLFITSKMEDPTLYMTELYLILFWIFTVSGLRLWQAIVSAIITSAIILYVTYFFFSLSEENFLMHCFWMSASFSFGLLGAYLLEKSYKEVFSTHEQLTQLAVTDKLTGLYNRNKLDELLKDELNRNKYFQHRFGLAIMDIDHFKNINDTYGHQIGDTVLIEIGELIQEEIRSTDKVIRWGGEEFIIIYLETDKQEVIRLVEQLRQKIEQHIFSKSIMLTVSLGLTLCSNEDSNASIIKRADIALYIAKNNGRNHTEFV